MGNKKKNIIVGLVESGQKVQSVEEAADQFNEQRRWQITHIKYAFIAGAQWRAEQNGWIEITPNSPDVGDRVLVIDDDGDQFIDIRMGDMLGEHTDERWHVYTHWQPLPEKPQI